MFSILNILRPFMRLQEIGYRIREARIGRELTQAQLAKAARVSRTTLNQLENGLFPELGVKKLRSILDQLDLELAIQPAKESGAPDFVRMACTTASVSYRTALTEEELIRTLLTGKIPPGRRPHFRTLLDESSPDLLKGLVDQVSRWSKPGRVEMNLLKMADDIKPLRGIREWLKTA